jgi:cellulose synthase/poly-beta-1,6-N-acetylglucosamine synthase-like glycosyltransferase
MDLTWRIRLAGKRIVTENDALAYTEAPEGLGGFSRQRFRWAFGTMQCLWKHRGAMLRAKYGVFGMFALPSLFVNQILFQAVAPAIDLALIIALFAGNLPQLLFYYAMFLVIEMVGALFAFSMDRERKLPIFLLMLQRFVYRQIMIYVILRSIATALRGMRTGWGSVERKGTARAPG